MFVCVCVCVCVCVRACVCVCVRERENKICMFSLSGSVAFSMADFNYR